MLLISLLRGCPVVVYTLSSLTTSKARDAHYRIKKYSKSISNSVPKLSKEINTGVGNLRLAGQNLAQGREFCGLQDEKHYIFFGLEK